MGALARPALPRAAARTGSGAGARFYTATECEFLRNPIRIPGHPENSRFGTAICAGAFAAPADGADRFREAH